MLIQNSLALVASGFLLKEETTTFCKALGQLLLRLSSTPLSEDDEGNGAFEGEDTVDDLRYRSTAMASTRTGGVGGGFASSPQSFLCSFLKRVALSVALAILNFNNPNRQQNRSWTEEAYVYCSPASVLASVRSSSTS